jgi:diacylglycerol O-acyltransferase
MKHLSGVDAAFLYGETPNWHMHVCSLAILDPTDAPGGFSFERLKELLVERLPSVPQFRWKYVEVPFGLDRPGWIEDKDFDPDFHVRHVAAPMPGGPEELGELVGHLMSYKLNRDKPLWELWVISGLQDGKVAVLAKVHHAVIDGVSGAGLADIIFDIEPTPRPAPTEVHLSLEDESVPGVPELLARGAVNALVRTPVRMLRFSSQLVGQARTMLGLLREGSLPVMPFAAPRTIINADLTPHRYFVAASVDLDRIKAVKAAFDVKVNDVVLAICAGLLLRYLAEVDTAPEASLVAQVPVSLHTEESKGEVGNKVGNMFVSLHTDMDDPGERLQAIYASTQSAKESRKALSAHQIMGITETAPPALIALAARGLAAARLGHNTPPPVTTVVSNVPGPPFPLYMAGAKVEAMYPMGPLMLGMGLNITIFSISGQAHFGFTTCPDVVPRPELLAEGVELALAELEKAAG